MKIKLILALTLLLSTFSSCKKDCYENKNSTKDVIEFANGRLSFASTKKFEETIKNLKSNRKLSLNEKLLASIGEKNYSELLNQKNSKTKSDISEDDDDELIDDIEFKALLNEDNEIEVEGTVYKITTH